MAVLYLDSSALVKLYASEEHSSWTLDLVRGAGIPLGADRKAEGDETRLDALRAARAKNAVAVSAVAWVECLAALAAKERVRALTRAERLLVEDALAQDFSERFVVRPVSGRVLAAAGRLAVLRALRAYDAVQLATALRLRSNYRPDPAGDLVYFLTFDERLRQAAEAEERLRVYEPPVDSESD